MKDIQIEVVAGGGRKVQAYAAKASGLPIERPILAASLKEHNLAEAAFLGLIATLDSIDAALQEDDLIDASLHWPGCSSGNWISHGTGIPHIDALVRNRVQALARRGISLCLDPSEHPDRRLSERVQMETLMNS